MAGLGGAGRNGRVASWIFLSLCGFDLDLEGWLAGGGVGQLSRSGLRC